jgi:hypothetical protein
MSVSLVGAVLCKTERKRTECSPARSPKHPRAAVARAAAARAAIARAAVARAVTTRAKASGLRL